MVVAICGTGPCQRDVDYSTLAETRTVATLNGARVPGATYAMFQQPSAVEEYIHASEGRLVLGARCSYPIQKSEALSDVPDPIERGITTGDLLLTLYQLRLYKVGFAKDVQDEIAMRGFEYFDERERDNMVPLDTALAFALAYFRGTPVIELYGIDLDEECYKKQKIAVDRMLEDWPGEVVNCCPSSNYKKGVACGA